MCIDVAEGCASTVEGEADRDQRQIIEAELTAPAPAKCQEDALQVPLSADKLQSRQLRCRSSFALTAWRSRCRVLRLERDERNTGTINQHRTMLQFTFDPPLTLKGNIVVRNLDDAVRFMVGYREARRPALQKRVLYRLEGAVGEAEERDAGYAFLGWAEAERLIVKSNERASNAGRK
jgi:hypothetical protein